MATTVTTNQSWFSRLSGSVKNVFIGLLLVLAAFPLLFWNEGRAVKTQKTLAEGAGAVISVESPDLIQADLDGELVHLTGDAEVASEIVDGPFGIGGEFILIDRKVEMYQWVELSESTTKENLGGSQETVTTYTYEKAWDDSLNRSSSFAEPEGHQNPTEFRYESDSVRNENVRLGSFTLDSSLIGQISSYSDLPVTEELLGGTVPEGAYIRDGLLYFGTTAGQPEVGDLRISFSVVNPGPISVIAKQAGSSLVPYLAETGNTIALLSTGTVDAAEMFAQAQANNKVLTWILRGGGILLMYIGFMLLGGVLSVLADVVPLFGSVIELGTKLISFVLALVLSGVTIALAWLTFRPLIGIGILVVIGAIVAGVIYYAKKKK